MSEPTREQALAKLDAFNQKIGYPDRWQDYAALDVPSGLVRRERAARARASDRSAISRASASRWTATSG